MMEKNNKNKVKIIIGSLVIIAIIIITIVGFIINKIPAIKNILCINFFLVI